MGLSGLVLDRVGRRAGPFAPMFLAELSHQNACPRHPAFRPDLCAVQNLVFPMVSQRAFPTWAGHRQGCRGQHCGASACRGRCLCPHRALLPAENRRARPDRDQGLNPENDPYAGVCGGRHCLHPRRDHGSGHGGARVQAGPRHVFQTVCLKMIGPKMACRTGRMMVLAVIRGQPSAPPGHPDGVAGGRYQTRHRRMFRPLHSPASRDQADHATRGGGFP